MLMKIRDLSILYILASLKYFCCAGLSSSREGHLHANTHSDRLFFFQFNFVNLFHQIEVNIIE